MLKNSIRLSLLLGIWCVTATQFAILAQQNDANWNPSNVTYPSAYRSNVTFTYPSAAKHGNVTVPDPYNWMEKPLNESVQLQTFVEEQDKLSQTYLDQCSDKEKISEKIRKGFNVTKYQGLTQYGTKESPVYLYSTTDQNHTKSLQWYLAKQTEMDHAKDKVLEQPPGRMIFDEKTLEVESASIQNWDIRDTADVAAYSVVFDGAVVASEIRFLNLSSPTVEPAYINETLQYGGAQSLFFTPDGKGLIYEWEILGDNKNPKSKVYYHQLGTDPKQDILLVKEDETDKINRWEASLSNDKKWMVLNGVDPDKITNTFYLTSMDQNLSSPQELKWISLSSNHTSRMRYMTNVDNKFYLLTNSQNATMFKVAEATIDPNKTQTTEFLSKLPVSCPINYDFIPEQKDAKIQAWMILSNTKVVLFHLKNANIHFDMFDLQSGKYDQTILQDFDGEAFSTSSKFDQGFIETSSFVSGSRTYQVRLMDDGKVETNVALDGGPQGIDTSAYKVQQHFAKSKDGTMIPFSVLFSKTKPSNANGTAWLYFYGSYGKNWFSSYDPFLLPWVDSFGGVFAYIQARGGSELGPKWHEQGMLGNRQNTFDDVQAVAQHMVDNNMAGNGKVILEGYSAGAEVAMAVVNQSPEGLIGTVLGDRGIYDMLRIVKFPYSKTQIEEWGDPNTAEGFNWIYPYSPLQNVKQNKTYPAILIMPAQNDTIVSNMHSYKMIATLQYLHPKNPKPLLLDLIANEGHKDTQQPLEKRIEVGTIKQCFASLSLNVELIG